VDDIPIIVDELSKNFRTRLGFSTVPAVNSIGIRLHRGEILGFLGPNGAGKTTTIKCILGLLKPSSGTISLWGSPPACSSVRRRIGYVPENPDYEDSFTPMEFLSMFASMRGLSTDSAGMLSILARVGLSNWENVRIRNFSKGMRQRVSMALALQSSPDLLIMDEPTGGLDPAARKEFRDIILEERDRGASVFFSSHLLSEVETICTRAVILSRGSKVAEGSMDDLLRTEDMSRITYHAAPGSEDITEIDVTSHSLQETIDRLRAEGCEISEIRPVFRSLEEVFLSATGGESR